jgi:3,4-dihydroxy 2-butanone 4-phosphate synthase/GTP cyclohydrolase II
MSTNPGIFHDIPDDVVGALQQGQLVVLTDADRGRGIVAGIAALMTARNATLMAIQARGLLSIAVDRDSAIRLGLRRMPTRYESDFESTEYLVSIEAAICEGTGISADDRALTIRCAGAPDSTSHDIRTPGHIMPLLVWRPDRPEASLPEIAHLIVKQQCGFSVAAWCHILNEQGEVATVAECQDLARRCNLPCVNVSPAADARTPTSILSPLAGRTGALGV